MSFFYSDNYENLQVNRKTNGKDPEHNLTNKLFYFGLFIEAVAIIYSVGSINISNEKNHIKYFYETANGIQGAVYLLALLCLLIHQTYIKNNIIAVTEIRVSKFNLQYKEKGAKKRISSNKLYTYDFFPANLLFSKFEYCLRFIYFVLLAVIAGEIPYLLMVIEKILHKLNIVHTVNNDYLVYSFSTIFFIISCGILCLIVLAWDILILVSFQRLLKLDGDKKEIPYSKEKLFYFILSDLFSLFLWLCILIFIITNNQIWINTLLLIFSFAYSLVILLRFFFKDGVNVKLSYK